MSFLDFLAIESIEDDSNEEKDFRIKLRRFMKPSNLDHIVLTVKNIETSAAFYETVMGMKREVFGEGRVSLKF